MDPEEEALANALADLPESEAQPIEPEVQAQEAEPEFVYDPNEQYVDDNGREWKPNETTGEWEMLVEAEPVTEPVVTPAAAQVATAQPAEEKPYTPAAPTYNIPGLTKERQAEIDEIAITQGYVAAQLALAPYLQAQQLQAQAVANYHLDQAQAKSPEFYGIHRRSIESVLAQMPPEQRATKQAVDDATLWALRQEMLQTGDIEATILRAAGLLQKNKQKPAAQTATPPRVLPPSQRATAPTVAPSRAATVRDSIPADVKFYMQLEGITQDEAQRIVNLQRRSR